MKARFFVTIDVVTPKSSVEKIKVKDAKAEVTAFIEDKINESFGDLNPTNIKVRFPRK